MKAVAFDERRRTRSYAPSTPILIRRAENPHVLWQKMRRLMTLAATCPYSFDTLDDAKAAQRKLHDDALILAD